MSKNFSVVERHKIIVEYTKHLHKIKEKEIKKGVESIEKQWKKIEGKYYKFVENLFQKHPWPKGKYIAYASVYLMFPRDIEDKTFYFPYNNARANPLRTIAHEMLHFIFFDYIQMHYSLNERSKLKNKNSKYLWQVSEIFNNVIENWKPYQDIFGIKENTKLYFDCDKLFAAMAKEWNKKQDIKVLLDKFLLK